MIEETFPAIQKAFEGQILNTNKSQHLLLLLLPLKNNNFVIGTRFILQKTLWN
jgi:hypothetical protein